MKSNNRNSKSKLFYLLFSVLVLALAITASAQTSEDPYADYSTEPIEVSRTLSEDGLLVNIVVDIPVSQDTFITSGQPDRNWGGDPNLRLGYNLNNGWSAERILMRFDFSSIPQDAIVNNAVFRINQTESNPSDDPPLGYSARFLNSSWDEFQVTWNSHQPDWGSVFASGQINNVNGLKEGDATDLVKLWVSGQRANYGFTIIANETPAQHERVFSARETGVAPIMRVDYTESVDNIPPTAAVNPLPPFSPDSFLVTWQGQDNEGGSGIDHYDVQYQFNGSAWVNWRMTTRDTQATFVGGANGTTYGFRARAVDRAGNVQAWSPTAQTQTLVDTISPTAQVNPLPQCVFTQHNTISWMGSDNTGGSGIANYDLQYQIAGGQWINWLTGTTDTSVQVTGGENGVTYGFRARATDNAGNVQPWSPNAQTETTVSIDPPVSRVTPIIPSVTSADTIPVSWSGSASPCTTILGFDVRYRRDQESWVNWQVNTTNLSDVLDVSSMPDGNYQFEARATDSMARTEAWQGVGEAFVIVRRSPPFIDISLYLPQWFSQTANNSQPAQELTVDGVGD
jgi:hypothetical protein